MLAKIVYRLVMVDTHSRLTLRLVDAQRMVKKPVLNGDFTQLLLVIMIIILHECSSSVD